MRVLLVVAALAAAAAQPPANLPELIAAHPRRPELAPGQQPGEVVAMAAGSAALHGYIYRPQGAGPFPAVLWNHGSEKEPRAQPELAAFYTAHGFVFFIPHRRGHGLSDGRYIVDLQRAFAAAHAGDRDAVWKEQVRLLEMNNADVAAALDWLKAQPYVDRERIVMSGCSYGGIQTLLAAEQGWGVKGFVPFAPAAMSWANQHLRGRLRRAVRNARAPLFLLQAENDYSTGPTEVLGPAIRERGAPNQAKLYPPFGATSQHGPAAFACWNPGTRVWGADVMEFLGAVLRSGGQAR